MRITHLIEEPNFSQPNMLLISAKSGFRRHSIMQSMNCLMKFIAIRPNPCITFPWFTISCKRVSYDKFTAHPRITLSSFQHIDALHLKEVRINKLISVISETLGQSTISSQMDVWLSTCATCNINPPEKGNPRWKLTCNNYQILEIHPVRDLWYGTKFL